MKRILTLAAIMALLFSFCGSVRAQNVDRDFGVYHKNDANQFGDDRAYNASNGRSNREADYQAKHWVPETYGLMGDYWYDSNGSG